MLARVRGENVARAAATSRKMNSGSSRSLNAGRRSPGSRCEASDDGERSRRDLAAETYEAIHAGNRSELTLRRTRRYDTCRRASGGGAYGFLAAAYVHPELLRGVRAGTGDGLRRRLTAPKTTRTRAILHRFCGETRANNCRRAGLSQYSARSFEERDVRFLKTSEAAALLNVSPNTLRAWERRFGYPKPQRSPGKHRLYTHGEVAALRDALQEGLSISSAISRAREGISADGDTLVGALGSFDRDRADIVHGGSLGPTFSRAGSRGGTAPVLDEVARRHGTDSARWAFAARWSNDWLRRAQRLAPPPVRQVSILLATRRETRRTATPLSCVLSSSSVSAGAPHSGLSVRGSSV